MKCAVKGCTNDRDCRKGKSFFRFPKNEEMKKMWLDAIKETNLSIKTSSVICEDHFLKTDILLFPEKRYKKLISVAVPSLHIDMADNKTSKDIQFVRVQSLSEFELIPMPMKVGEIKEEPDPLLELVTENSEAGVNKQIPTISLIESDSEDIVESKSNSNQPLIITLLDSDSEDDVNTDDSKINSNTLSESLLYEPCDFPQNSVSNIKHILPGQNVSILKVPTAVEVPPLFFTENNPSLNQTTNAENYTSITKKIRTIKQVFESNEPDKNEAEVLAKIRILLKENIKRDKLIQSLEQKVERNKEQMNRLNAILSNFKDRLDLPEVHARLTPENISELTFLRQCHLVQNKSRKRSRRKGKSEPLVSDNIDKSTECSNNAIATVASQPTTIPDTNNVGTDLYEEALFNEIIEVCSPADDIE